MKVHIVLYQCALTYYVYEIISLRCQIRYLHF